MKSYRDLEIYKLSFSLARDVHFIAMKLPGQERFELGSQTRRSAQSVRANIVEGYGRNHYKKDFIHFLVTSHASCLETISHLEMLRELYLQIDFNNLITQYDTLGSQIYRFIKYVEINWRS